ncbi:HRDC domain-containing protein [Deinococcus peraridilitoris]|uniref:Cystathionine beta-lyase/cystathionine gamma-synthase n=1 Tax=Deinococcus peraridilitoris (strain DSM 19664 / LMG 22246 / CIP 109416 / KR-200) TaxID=937777 RepID=K9ZZS2_DEIPD|nr:HRDC domain-containing protein [Deinococcus peraridilitoris]AFZ66689.1 cystathionine beta-lyase/cystathionine gamma-synthase [Deinococcus peraridilitoris DSM 19664]
MNHTFDTRLARAAHPADHTPFADLLAALEGADWALLFPDEAALLSALASLSGGATLRIDPRVPLRGVAARAAGFELGAFDADWRESLVWTFQPDERAVKRARKAEARLIADVTYAPGSGVFASGVSLAAYRDAGALSGHGDVTFAALLGIGEVPALSGTGVPALAETLLRRDLASLGARRERQQRTAEQLAERLGKRASLVSGALMLVSQTMPSTGLFSAQAALGGVVSARRDTEGETLLSIGLEDIEDLWSDLTGDVALAVVADDLEADAAAQAPEVPAVPGEAADVDDVQDEATALHAEPQPEGPLAPDLPQAPGSGEGDPTAGLSEEQLAAFERLREWRNAEARRQEVSRFIVASNATLAEIARHAPQNEAELRQVKGMGPERVRKYAERILNMTRGLGK